MGKNYDKKDVYRKVNVRYCWPYMLTRCGCNRKSDWGILAITLFAGKRVDAVKNMFPNLSNMIY